MRDRTFAVIVTLLILICVPGFAGSIPVEVVGHWYNGTVSSVNFYNPDTGQFAAPSGTGMYFKFNEDGSYEKGFLMQSSMYNCTMTVFAFNTGKFKVEEEMIQLIPKYGRMKSIDNCVSSNNYEKPDELKNETLIWKSGVDDYGKTTLWLGYPNSNPSAFHRK